MNNFPVDRRLGFGDCIFWVFAVVVAGLAYFLALSFVFPGSFEPVAVPHSDIYMPLAIANSPFNWGMPRITGVAIDFFRGRFGLEFSAIFPVVIACINAIGTAYLASKIFFQRTLAGKNSLYIALGLFVYLWLIFTHRYFYIFSGWDAYAQYSYFFLFLALAWLRRFWARALVGISGFFLLTCIGFMSKETYVVSFLVILPFAVWNFALSDVSGREGNAAQNGVWVKIFCVSLVMLLAFLLAFWLSRYLNSPFTGHDAAVDSPYRLSLSPSSVLSEWIRYARDGMNLALGLPLCLLLGFLVFCARSWKAALPFVIPVVSGGLSWLPNSVLPNHHFEQYSVTGSYLYFLPFFFVAIGWPAFLVPMIRFRLLVVVFFVTLPFFNSKLFRHDSVQFYRIQMERQAGLNNVLGRIAHSSVGIEKKPVRNLLVGVAPPFNPFVYPPAFLKYYFSTGTSLDVVNYPSSGGSVLHQAASDGVEIRLVDVGAVDLAAYDVVWSIGLNGGLIEEAAPKSLAKIAQSASISMRDLILYPELRKIFLVDKDPTEKEFLDCGQIYRQYVESDKALVCLEKSMRVAPSNPYPYFFYALALESIGDLGGAVSYMEKANSQEVGPKNPAFQSELTRLRQNLNN